MSPFDPDTFMQQNLDGPVSTEYLLCPEGEYQMMVDDFDSRAFETFDFTYKQGDRAGQPGQMHKFTCPFVIMDEKVKLEMARDKVVVDKQINLDITAEGKLDTSKGKNVELGRVFEAVGLNAAGTPVASLRNAGPLMGLVKHVTFKRKDGSEGKRAEVSRVAPIR